MKNKVLQRPMFMSDDDVENVGIMQGFMDDLGEIFDDEKEDGDEDYETGKMMGRTPDSPEIIMNNLRGDVRSVDARVEELADMVGYRAASATPMEVLALLQPVLAGQGAGQGIASLPMGTPEQAAPPMPAPMGAEMPTGGAPPPMPGGGIASLPQGQSAPMAMAKGGLVQYFQDGSDEDGVTLPMVPSSSSTTVSQRLRQAAEDEILNFLGQQPMEVPDLRQSMEERIPLYQSILGTGDKDSMRAQMLFDIAQAALGYAGNVSPQGQPLRGSPVARLGAAFSAVPGQIGTRLAAQQEQNQAVRLAALQAAEKDIQNIREYNADLQKEQRSLMGSVARTDTTGRLFGSGYQGSTLEYPTVLAPRILAGTATPEEQAIFESSIFALQSPVPKTDPITGQIIYVTQPLPATVAKAARSLGITVDTPQLGTPATGPDEQQVPVLERNILTVQPRSENYFEANMPSLYNAADAQGPVPALNAFLFRTPILNAVAGSSAGSQTEGRQFIEAAKNSLAAGFQAGTDRFSNAERQQVLSDLNVASAAFDNPDAFKRRLFALDDTLQSIQASALATYRNTDLPPDSRKQAMDKLNDVHEIRALIGVPLHISDPEDPRAVDIVSRYPLGTEFLVTTGPDGQTVRRVVTQEMKDRLSGTGAP
jgi:hypothetical protein